MTRTDLRNEKIVSPETTNPFLSPYLRRFKALASSKSNKKEAMDITASIERTEMVS